MDDIAPLLPRADESAEQVRARLFTSARTVGLTFDDNLVDIFTREATTDTQTTVVQLAAACGVAVARDS